MAMLCQIGSVLHVLVLCALFNTGVAATVVWTGTTTLKTAQGSDIQLSYVADQEYLTIELVTQTSGWIGFGLAEENSGGMAGADIVTCYMGGVATVEDRHVKWAPFVPGEARDFFPTLDHRASDWEAVEVSEVAGTTRCLLRRLLDTGDKDDRVVLSGPNRVIFAHGPTDSVSYHGSSRGASVVDFSSPEQAQFLVPPDSPHVLALKAGNYTIPSVQTTYGCRYFDLNERVTPIVDRHITAIEVLLDSTTEKFVHHLLVHVCPTRLPEWETMQSCSSILGTVCKSLIYGWAVGGGPLVLPEEAGFRMGATSEEVRHVVLEIHYDNPELHELQQDDSGVKLYFTDAPNARPYDASTVVLGNTLFDFDSIKRGTESHYQAVCPGECTRYALKGRPLHVFGSFLHMHSFGRQFYAAKTTDGIVNRVDFWNFEFQQITPVNYTINPGDSLHTHCTFDATKSTVDVRFGIASDQEMCLDVVFYYPKIPKFGVCGNGVFNARISGEAAAAAFDQPCKVGGFYDLCDVNYPVSLDATFCGDVDFEGVLRDSEVDLSKAELRALLSGSTSVLNEVLGRYVLRQKESFDERGILEVEFGSGADTPETGGPTYGNSFPIGITISLSVLAGIVVTGLAAWQFKKRTRSSRQGEPAEAKESGEDSTLTLT